MKSLFLLIFWARINLGLRVHPIGTSIQNLKPLPTKKKVLERGFDIYISVKKKEGCSEPVKLRLSLT